MMQLLILRIPLRVVCSLHVLGHEMVTIVEKIEDVCVCACVRAWSRGKEGFVVLANLEGTYMY